MDFLGLRTLSIIDEALKLIETVTGAALDLDQIPLDDAETFSLLQAGDHCMCSSWSQRPCGV